MIELEGITKTYADGLTALPGISIRLDQGMFGLLGPNGAGKTTFLSILVLGLEPTAGRRVYDGLDAASARARGRRSGGGSASFLRTITPSVTSRGGSTSCTAPGCARCRSGRAALRRRVAELLESVGLERAADRRAGEYSGGMQRRLGIAQALLHSPRLLVVDEPTAGLDPEERIRFRSLITGVAESTTVLLSTHIVEDVEATCPRLGVIAGGRLLFDGSPTELLRRAAGRLWQIPAGGAAAGRRGGGHAAGRPPGRRRAGGLSARRPVPGAVSPAADAGGVLRRVPRSPGGRGAP